MYYTSYPCVNRSSIDKLPVGIPSFSTPASYPRIPHLPSINSIVPYFTTWKKYTIQSTPQNEAHYLLPSGRFLVLGRCRDHWFYRWCQSLSCMSPRSTLSRQYTISIRNWLWAFFCVHSCSVCPRLLSLLAVPLLSIPTAPVPVPRSRIHSRLACSGLVPKMISQVCLSALFCLGVFRLDYRALELIFFLIRSWRIAQGTVWNDAFWINGPYIFLYPHNDFQTGGNSYSIHDF